MNTRHDDQELPPTEVAQLPAELGWCAIEALPDAITITDAAGTIVYVNPAFSRITGYSRAEAVGQNPRILKSGRHDAAFYSSLWRELTTTGCWQGQIWNRRKDGEAYPERIAISALRDPDGRVRHYLAIFSDDTSFQGLRAELERLAFEDPLTGLPNRRLLRDRCEQALARATRRAEQAVALVYLDLDGFKPINDLFGHDAGDAVLREVARRLSSTVRGTDTVARIGGDEFAILVDGLTPGPADLAVACARVEQVLARPFLIGDEAVRVGATLGIAFAGRGECFEALLARADQAMYREKASRLRRAES